MLIGRFERAAPTARPIAARVCESASVLLGYVTLASSLLQILRTDSTNSSFNLEQRPMLLTVVVDFHQKFSILKHFDLLKRALAKRDLDKLRSLFCTQHSTTQRTNNTPNKTSSKINEAKLMQQTAGGNKHKPLAGGWPLAGRLPMGRCLGGARKQNGPNVGPLAPTSSAGGGKSKRATLYVYNVCIQSV